MPAQDFDAFHKSVKKGEIVPAYYFHGDEDLLKDELLRDLLAKALDPATRDFNFDRRRTGDLGADDFTTLAQTPPMMAPRRAVVLTEVEVLQQRRPRVQALRAAIVDYLTHPAPDAVLVLVQSADQKEDADFVRLARSVSFDRLTPDRLQRWIRHRAGQEKLEIDEEGARHLHEAVGDDLPQLAAEIAKLRSAVADRSATADDVADLVGVRRGETVHAFVDAVTGRRFAVAADMVRHLLEGPGTSGVRLIMTLGTAMAGVACARAVMDRGGNPGSAASELESVMFKSRPWGLRAYKDEARRWATDAKGWSLPDLERGLAELLRADKRLKTTTVSGEAEIVIDAVLALAGMKAVA